MATMHHAAGTTPSKLDIPTRLSYVSGTSYTKDPADGYTGVKTPDPNDIEGGALREGGMPVLTSKENIGLLCQYAAVGMVYGMLPATIYPLLQNYLNCSGAQVTTAATLVVFPWSFKCFYGILSDCFPIFGYRRRPYMLIGWGICLVMLLIMACMPAGKPYYTVSSDRNISPEDYTPEIEARINYDASSQGAKYVILMFFAAFGYVLADVCADSIVVDLAQREPVDKRGKTQSAIYVVRTVFVIIGEIITGFAFNGEEYGGDFDFSMTFPQLMIVLAASTALVIPSTWFLIKEEKKPKVNFREYMTTLWDLLCTRAMYQVIAYNFFSNIFAGISYTASSPVQSYMVGVTPINSTISDILGNLLFMFGIMITSKWGLHWSWRGMIVFTGIFVMIVDGVCTFITVWDVFRSQWFWLGLPIAVQVPYGVGWMISNFVIVELSGIGNEGAVYGLVTATHNVASPFATTLTLLIDQPFNLSTERIQVDDHSIRADVSYSVIIMYAMTAFSWVFLFLLPKQKEDTQELVRNGGSNKIIGGITLFYLLFALVWSVMTNIMAMFNTVLIRAARAATFEEGNTGSTDPAVNDLDIPKRMSFVSGTSQGKDLEEGSYTGVKTPDGAPGGEFEGGALRPGGMPVLTSKENLGLLIEYAVVGLVYGLLPETIYPFMQQYLNCSGSQVAAAKQLVTLPWSFKVFYGILSDCRPICGYRRRPYMLIGWGICLIMLLVMCIMPIGKPYYTVASDRNVAVADYTPEIEARINYNASSEGAKYVIIMCCAAIGYVMSDVCADSITVELAQREPLDKRGKTQSMIYTVRTAMVIFGEILVGFFFNGEDYGGDFDFSLSFPQLMIVVTVLMLPVFPMTWFFIKEEKKEAANFRQYISAFWDLLCTRAVYQVIAYNFFSNIFSTMTYTASSPVASYMVGVTPLNTTLSDILSNLLFMSGIMITSKWGLHWNWRWMIVSTAATLIVVDCVCEMIVIWDIFRNQWFWLGPPIVVQLPYGVGWIISTYVTVELAGLGNEGAVYGLITTVTNTAQPFATSLSLLVDGPFNITNERVQLDDHSIRMDITYTIIIMYCAMMFAWVFLFLLPKQKEDTQRLLREGGKSRLIGGFTVFYLCFAIVWSILTNILAIFDSTSCLIIAGGTGC
ncbi:hypothetical protein BBJ29_005070 [Phytophthora kernoviae]|uniref:Folate-Biopterin Transporter (FBT) Family n=1 Tax=Phytophthora kernoviae TaxID=325452 RepID=A0A3F2RHB8_9STRA|nr:hypothetical protein BBP00_00007735 [Phytophthora kernoviae]RLN59561.1 hypothetical protein BBJ29_005070 [Phytophthora kernoviae]